MGTDIELRAIKLLIGSIKGVPKRWLEVSSEGCSAGT
jgi:hypothetical protein